MFKHKEASPIIKKLHSEQIFVNELIPFICCLSMLFTSYSTQTLDHGAGEKSIFILSELHIKLAFEPES